MARIFVAAVWGVRVEVHAAMLGSARAVLPPLLRAAFGHQRGLHIGKGGKGGNPAISQ